MKSWYREFFEVKDGEQVREKVLVSRMFVAVLLIVIGLAAMSLSAFAYFSHEASSGVGMLTTANFDAVITAVSNDPSQTPVTVEASGSKTYRAALDAGVTYRISVRHSVDSSASTGFLILHLDGSDIRYHTAQIGRSGNSHTDELTFYVTLDAPADLVFLAHWGTSSYYGYASNGQDPTDFYITEGETVALSAVAP